MHQSTSDEQLRARLLKAYEADPDRSKMGRLRKQYDTIIDLQKGGMSLEKILMVLNEDKAPDDRLTMKTFNGYLYLLRKEKKIQLPLEVGPVTPHTSNVQGEKSTPPKAPAAPGKLDERKPVSKKHGAGSGKSVATKDDLKEAMRATFDPNDFME